MGVYSVSVKVKNNLDRFKDLGTLALDKDSQRIALEQTGNAVEKRAARILAKMLKTKAADMNKVLPISVNAEGLGSEYALITLKSHGRLVNAARLPHSVIRRKQMRSFRVKIKGNWKTLRTNTYGMRLFDGVGNKKRVEPYAFLLPTKSKGGGLKYRMMRRIHQEGKKGKVVSVSSRINPAKLLEQSGQRGELEKYAQERLYANLKRQLRKNVRGLGRERRT